MGDWSSPTFLGLEESELGPWDIVVLPVPLEISVSYGEGTERGPDACIEASSQVELNDRVLENDLPCGFKILTAPKWSSDAPSLREQLNSIRDYVKKWIRSADFPLILGGEHGILLPIIEAMENHRLVRKISDITIVQIDAHADLRDELNGERFSHGTVIRRSLEAGVGNVVQIGVRALSSEEESMIRQDDRIQTWFAGDLLSVSEHLSNWDKMIASISEIEGPVWITFDVDGLDGSLVPSTGTPMPGGLSHWGAVEIIENLFSSEKCTVIGADINEIVPDTQGSLTQFSAALVSTKIVACHIANLINNNA